MSTMSKTELSRFITIELAENVFGIVGKGTHDWELYID